MDSPRDDVHDDDLLPEEVPVSMPELPARLTLNTVQQFKALGDATRWRIISLIQHQPATAKQIAERLKAAPGTIGHHLQVLEEAGLVQVVARRLVRGIVAKYYARTARIFVFDFPPEVKGRDWISLRMMQDARDELAETLEAEGDSAVMGTSFPRVRISAERASAYFERLKALVDDFLQETPDPDGQIYSLSIALFKAPPHLQIPSTAGTSDAPHDTEE